MRVFKDALNHCTDVVIQSIVNMMKRQAKGSMQNEQSHSKNEFDVVIVGAGAVGSALAIQLVDLGYQVAVIDAFQSNYASSDPERVIALSYGSKCYLESLGVWQGVADAGVGLIRHIHVSEPGNSGTVEMDLSQAETLADAACRSVSAMDALGYVVEMGHVLKPLHDKLKGSVEWIVPAVIEDVLFASDGRKTEIRLNIDGESRSLTTSLLVGADGTNSQIRRRAGIGTRGWDYNRFGLVLSARLEQSHNDIAYECFKDSGPLAFLPMSDGRYSIVWALTPTDAMRLLQMPEPLFIRKLERAAGADVFNRFGPVSKIGKRFCFPLELTVAERYAMPGVALVGNAAHTIHPVGGQGMNLGFRDAAVLAEVLATELAYDNPGAPILMQAYAEKRRADVMAVAGFTESMVNIFSFAFPPARKVRGGSMDILQKMPSLRSLLLGQASGIAQMQALKLPHQVNQGVSHE